MTGASADFLFAADLSGKINGKSFYCRVPGDIQRKDELFATLGGALWLPPDPGPDWDFLYDCLCDFGWMSDRKIMLVHDALPRLSDAELTHYLFILRDAVRWWRRDDPHEFEVIFPEAERPRIRRLLDDGAI